MTIKDLNPPKDLHAGSRPAGKKLTSDRMDAEGRLRIAAFLQALLGWDYPVTAQKLLGSGRVSPATIARAKRGEVVSDTMLRVIGDVLGLPRDFLIYIGYGNADRIERLLPEANDDFREVLRWTLDLFAGDDDPGEPRIRSA